MNDFDYEVMQKKRMASSARKKKNGSKSKACFLPSDNLTPAQLRKLNGEVRTYNLDAPMGWDDFKAMPNDLQVQYLQGLNSRFSVGLTTISIELFGKSPAALPQMFKRAGCVVSFAGKRLSGDERETWEQWLTQGVELEARDELPEENETPEAPASTEPVESSAFAVAKLAIEWEGELDGPAFVAQLTRLPLPVGRVKIKMEVEKL